MVTYFYGNGPLMANILTAVVYILNSADYSTLLTLMITLAGALTILDWHRTNVSGGLGFHSILVDVGVVVLLYYGAWAPKTSLVVSDPLNNFQTAVNNVPEGFAVIVYTSNRITNGFADLFEQGFGTSGFPNSMDYQNGMTPGLLSIESLGDLTPQDQFLVENISEYFNKCVFPAMLMGNGSGPTVNDLATSTNLLTTIQTSLSNAWQAEYYSEQYPQGQSVYCSSSGGTPDLYDNIVTDINNAINNPTGSISQAYANQMLMGFAGAAQYSNPTTDQNLLQTASQYMVSGSLTSQQMLAQSVLINSFNPALQQFASANGMNINALSSSLTQNVLSTTASMNASYALAQQLLPLAFLVISALIYAILPIVFAMMFIPQLTRKFGLMAFDLLMWIAFWAPLAAVINDIVQSVNANTWSTFGSNAIAMNNWGYMMAHTHTLMAIAGDMMFSVPVLAFALASGSSYAMTAVAGSITGLSKNFSGTAGTQMGSVGGATSVESNGDQLGKFAKELPLDPNTQNLARNLVDMQASNPAASLMNMQKFGYDYMTTAAANNMAHQAGQGAGYGAGDAGMGNAASVGELQTGQQIGQIEGAYQGYEGAVKDGYQGSFTQWVGMQSKYQNTNMATQAQAMQKLANEYFGGDLNKEMSFLNNIKSQQSLGGVVGEQQAYQMAVANGFKGNLTDFEAYQQKMHSAINYGQNVGAQNAANVTSGGNVVGATIATRTGGNERNFAESMVMQNLIGQHGLGAIIQDKTNSENFQLGTGAGLGKGAYGIGEILAGKQVGEAKALGSNVAAQSYASFNTREKLAEQAYLHDPNLAGLYKAISTQNASLGQYAVLDGNVAKSVQQASVPWNMALSNSKSNAAEMIRQKISVNSANEEASMIQKKYGNNAEIGVDGRVYVSGQVVGKIGTPGIVKAILGASAKTEVRSGIEVSGSGGYHDTATFSVEQFKQAVYDKTHGILDSNSTAQQKEQQLNAFYGSLKELRTTNSNVAGKVMHFVDKAKGQNDNGGNQKHSPDISNTKDLYKMTENPSSLYQNNTHQQGLINVNTQKEYKPAGLGLYTEKPQPVSPNTQLRERE